MLRRTILLSPLALPQYEESRGETPWVPSPDEVIDTMLRMARVGSRDVVYDLGCGDGRVVIAAARMGARAVGIDIEPVRISEANEAAAKAGMAERVRFVEQDFHQADITSATVVALYLYTREMTKLKPKLRAQLKPGSRVVAYQFNGMGNWKPKKMSRKHHYPVYLWVV
jgi:cyclopropane fatty-acyl-phospholipid synthase-like methyltransferase